MKRKPEGRIWGLVVFSIAGLVLSFANLSGYLMNDDEGTYLYAAWRVGQGDVPYRDFNIVQAPLSFYLGGALFGIFGPSVWAARALSAAFMLGAAWFLYAGARRFLKLETGFALAAAGIFLFNKNIFFLGRSFMPDVPMIFFGAAALYFALRAEEPGAETAKAFRKWAFLAGLMTGFSTLAKINGGLILAGYGAFLVLEAVRKRQAVKELFRKAFWCGAGFLLSFGLPFALFLVFVPGTYDGVIGFHAAKAAETGFTYAALVFRRWAQTVGNHNYALAAGALAALVLIRRGREKSDEPPRGNALLWAMAAAPLVLLFLPGRFFLRYAIYSFAPASLLFGLGVRAMWRKRTAGRIGLPLLAVLVLLCLGPTLSPRKILARDEGTRAAAAFIREHTEPGDYVFGDDPFLNFLAGRPCPPGLVDVSEAMVTGGRITSEIIREACERYAVKLVFVESGASAHHLVKLRDYPAFRNYLLDAYQPAGTVRREFLDIEFFLRPVH